MEVDDFFELSFINVTINGEPHKVCVEDYSLAKTKELQEFGYGSLTQEQVIESIKRVLKGEKMKDVIDQFVKQDIILAQ